MSRIAGRSAIASVAGTWRNEMSAGRTGALPVAGSRMSSHAGGFWPGWASSHDSERRMASNSRSISRATKLSLRRQRAVRVPAANTMAPRQNRWPMKASRWAGVGRSNANA